MIGKSRVGHRNRFQRWQRRVGPATRLLSERLTADLVLVVEAYGFRWVDFEQGNSEWPVDANCVRLERRRGDICDYIEISFAKYGRPKFQIHFGCEPSSRRANLVAHSNEYYHFWGKPWWRPLWAWSQRDADKIVTAVIALLPQVLQFLEDGTRRPNISLPIRPKTDQATSG